MSAWNILSWRGYYSPTLPSWHFLSYEWGLYNRAMPAWYILSYERRLYNHAVPSWYILSYTSAIYPWNSLSSWKILSWWWKCPCGMPPWKIVPYSWWFCGRESLPPWHILPWKYRSTTCVPSRYILPYGR